MKRKSVYKNLTKISILKQEYHSTKADHKSQNN